MDAGTFYMWLANHFIPNIPPARPVVLLVDSADGHIDLQTFELAKENRVHIFALLKNATHLVQPADFGLFGAMKQTWYKHVRGFSQKHPGTDITKENFCSVFKSTWDDVMRPSTLKEAFRKSVIYPICRDQITDDQVRSSLVYSHSDQSTLPSNTACESPLPEPTRTPFVTSTMSTLSPSEQSASQCETSSLLPQVCESPLPQESEPLRVCP